MHSNGYEVDDDLLDAVLRICNFDPDQAVARLETMGFRFELQQGGGDGIDVDVHDDDDPDMGVTRNLSDEEKLLKEAYAASLSEGTSRQREEVFAEAAGPNPRRYCRLFLPVQNGQGGAIVGTKFQYTNKIIEAVRAMSRSSGHHPHLIVRFLDDKILQANGQNVSCIMVEGVLQDQVEKTNELLLAILPLILPSLISLIEP